MRSGLDEQYGLLNLQNRILEIAKFIDELCTANNIDYCLMGGSALGAKRHGGFIPWDDDLDVFMTPDNYEKFREVFQNNADQSRYYLQEWGAVDGMTTISKVRLNGTTYLEGAFKDWDIHQGIYVDIFILHTCPNNKLAQMIQCFWAKYAIMKGLANRNYRGKGGLLGLAIRLIGLTPSRFLLKYALRQVYKYRDCKTNFYCNFLGRAVFKNAIYKRVFFERTRYAPFETIRLRVPVKLHEFLTDRFGDYMTPPPPEAIKRMQHAEKWDVDKDFREYLDCIDSFGDERRLI